MRRMNSSYMKFQTKWVRLPAMIEAYRGTETLAVRVHPSREARSKAVEPATIYLDPHEAQGFASWLSQQADRMIQKAAKAEARRLARAAAKKGSRE